LEIACGGSQESYSESEVAAILKRFRFEYQGIELPSGHRTTGDDRSASMELVFAEDLAGKTVLDVGCAYGYFCFEAERRGASCVTGTELKSHRFVGANVLREVLGSDVRILKQDIFAEGAEEEYDVVLLLNVLHHLPEPIKALRTLGRLCREKLIIEFPTLLDPKYGGTLGEVLPEEVNNLPLIGVSLPAECDQYFLFTEAAIRRVLSDQVGGFMEIEILPSPMAPDRKIAVCRRSCGKREAAARV
jgi:SAM-dependent methyltransferase